MVTPENARCHCAGAPACPSTCQAVYEVAGSGSLLLTDWKTNMSEIFSPGTECVTYRDTDECVRMAKFFLQNDGKREEIALAGHRRVIAEHTYEHRVGDLLRVIEKHLH